MNSNTLPPCHAIYIAAQIVTSNTPRLEIIVGISGLASLFAQLLNALLIKRHYFRATKGKADFSGLTLDLYH